MRGAAAERIRRFGWWRVGWIVAVVGLTIAAVAVLASGSRSSHTSHVRPGIASPTSVGRGGAAPEPPSTPSSPAPAPTAAGAPSTPSAPAASKSADGGFTLVAFSLDAPEPDAPFSGQATIRNDGSDRSDGVWEVRLYKGPQVVGTLQATGVAIDPGQAATLQMQSSDPYVAGVDRYEFRTVTRYPS